MISGLTQLHMLIYPHNCKAALQHSANGSSGAVACHPSQRRTALLAVSLAAMLAVAVAATEGLCPTGICERQLAL